MSDFMALFRTAAFALKSAAESEFAKTAAAKLFAEVSRAKSAGWSEPDDLAGRLSHDMVRAFGAFGPELRETPLPDVLSTVEKYARAPGDGGDVIRELLGLWGPFGKALGELAGLPTWIGADLGRQFQAAIRLAQAVGQVGELEGDWVEQVTQHALELARLRGYRVLGPGETRGDRPQEPGPRRRGGPPGDSGDEGEVDVPMAWEPPRRVPPNHPLVTGDMVPAPGSSNVHSFGYDYDEATLFVRFLDSLADGVRAGPGPLYAYFDVEPEMFLDMMDTASKGNWVWDNLRIRGTVSGHKKDYRLAGIVRGYVPRKATLVVQSETELAEAFLPRSVRGASGRWLKSALGEEIVRPMRATGPVPPGMRPLFGL